VTKTVETLFEDQPQAGGYKVTSRTDSPDGNFEQKGPIPNPIIVNFAIMLLACRAVR
jgi:hypothetical protein